MKSGRNPVGILLDSRSPVGIGGGVKSTASDCVYAMHPLVHTWGRDRMHSNEKKQCCLMAYVTLSCSLRWDEDQPYGFRRILVTHIRANMEHSRSESNKNGVTYLDDSSAKCGRSLMEQGYSREAENLEIKVLDTRNRILGVEHADTINAMAHLATTYWSLGKYTEAEKLDVQVLDARNRILGVEHPHTINAMANLAATYQNMGKNTKAEKLDVQAQEIKTRVPGAKSPNMIATTANIQEAHRTQASHVRIAIPEEETSDSIQAVLNSPPLADLPDMIMNPRGKGMK